MTLVHIVRWPYQTRNADTYEHNVRMNDSTMPGTVQNPWRRTCTKCRQVPAGNVDISLFFSFCHVGTLTVAAAAFFGLLCKVCQSFFCSPDALLSCLLPFRKLFVFGFPCSSTFAHASPLKFSSLSFKDSSDPASSSSMSSSPRFSPVPGHFLLFCPLLLLIWLLSVLPAVVSHTCFPQFQRFLRNFEFFFEGFDLFFLVCPILFGLYLEYQGSVVCCASSKFLVLHCVFVVAQRLDRFSRI